jgi:hypothetical protein
MATKTVFMKTSLPLMGLPSLAYRTERTISSVASCLCLLGVGLDHNISIANFTIWRGHVENHAGTISILAKLV